MVCAQLLSRIQLFGSPMDCSPPGSSIHGISQKRILEWVAIPFYKGSSWPWDQIHICTGKQILYHCATWEVHLTSVVILSESQNSRQTQTEDDIPQNTWPVHLIFVKIMKNKWRKKLSQIGEAKETWWLNERGILDWILQQKKNSCWYMAKPIQYCTVKNKIKLKMKKRTLVEKLMRSNNEWRNNKSVV